MVVIGRLLLYRGVLCVWGFVTWSFNQVAVIRRWLPYTVTIIDRFNYTIMKLIDTCILYVEVLVTILAPVDMEL